MGDEFDILVAVEVQEFFNSLDDKSERIVKENLSKLQNPYPGSGKGDKERITWQGEEVHRLHIGRTWTAFYDINEDENIVRVLRIMDIDNAHKHRFSVNVRRSAD